MANKVMSEKEFDCIAAKREAQAAIFEDIKGIAAEQEIEYFHKAATDGPLGGWWKTVNKGQTNQTPKRSTTV